MPHNDPTVTLLPDPPGCVSYLVRVNPRDVNLTDPLTHEPVFDSLWQIETNIGGDLLVLLSDLRDMLGDPHYEPSKRALIADLSIWEVLRHPKSPYGLGWGPADPAEDDGMLVVFHGRAFHRDADGVLAGFPGNAVEWWPTRDQWRVNNFKTRLFARRIGLLP